MKFGLKSILVVIAGAVAILSAILVGSDTLAHAIYAADGAIALLVIAQFATDA